jgi:hypothetical protein
VTQDVLYSGENLEEQLVKYASNQTRKKCFEGHVSKTVEDPDMIRVTVMFVCDP